MNPRYPAVAVTLYAALAASDLPRAWVDAPTERGAWAALALWLAPIALGLRRREAPRTAGLGAGLALVFVGQASAVNALTYAGLAATLASWAPVGALHLVAALAWMPVAGWLTARLGLSPAAALTARCLVAAVGSGALFRYPWPPPGAETPPPSGSAKRVAKNERGEARSATKGHGHEA